MFDKAIKQFLFKKMIIYKKIFDNIKNRSYNNHNNNLFIKITKKRVGLWKSTESWSLVRSIL
ncbi:hypothetical protein ANHYDRO_00985 [Anaerococcus hydrogenalis DSM 7454]|uniref:Uncharacterized protein n=1 Tax=Anaerococcus hydrogenalis DSM 7454 TaxID=561177 RepID=B6W8T4_9FIRM|nr:hypothetical protein ANHYDRO_00985 [Anaerococcus hydrogenalis DSM 7454]